MADIETLAREAGQAVADAFANATSKKRLTEEESKQITEEWFKLWHSYRS